MEIIGGEKKEIEIRIKNMACHFMQKFKIGKQLRCNSRRHTSKQMILLQKFTLFEIPKYPSSLIVLKLQYLNVVKHCGNSKSMLNSLLW